MKMRVGLPSVLALASVLQARPIAAQTVANVRASQLADGTVEILYDLAGAADSGATVSVSFSTDGGGTWQVHPAASALSGHLGAGIASGASRRIVWSAAATLPPQTYGTSYRAAVTATNPSAGGQEETVTLPGGVPLVMVRVPAGTFQMGSPATEWNRSKDETPHGVTLSSDFYVGKYEVTQAQWRAVMGTNPSVFTSCGGSCPVERVSWNDVRGADGFVGKLNRLLGTTGFRLPTEAEWERAARGGTQTRFSFGDARDGDDGCAPNAAADPFVWWCANAGSRTRAVGTKGANPFGLYDVHGNVAEWVEDWYGSYPSTEQANPAGPATGQERVFRGGSWTGSLMNARSAERSFGEPASRFGNVGFRLALDLAGPPAGGTGTSNVFTIDLRTATCSLTCTAVVPAQGTTGAALPFLASVTASGCSGSPEYSWAFGDGETSTQQSPTHVYAASGTYGWSLVVTQGGETCTKTGNVSVNAPGPAPLIRFEFEGSGAYVYSVPFAIGDGRLREALGRLAWDEFAGAYLALILPRAGALETLGEVAELVHAAGNGADLVSTGPVATGLRIGPPASGSVAAETTAIGAVTCIDFIGASREIGEVTRIGQPLVLSVSETGVSLPSRSRSQVLLRADELSRLDPSSPYPKSFVIVPKTPFRVGDVPFECILCGNSYPVTVRASIGSVFSGQASLAVSKAPGAAAAVERQLEPGVPSRVDVPVSGTSRQAALVCLQPSDTLASRASSSPPAATSCSIQVRARDARTGAIHGSASVAARDYQHVDLGVLPAGGWYAEVESECPVPVGVTVFSRSVGGTVSEEVIPIALDVASSGTRFATEAAFFNRGTTHVHTRLTYAPSLGTREGAGSVSLTIAPGEQRVLPDVLSFLRFSGLAIPDRLSAPSQGGCVGVRFDGLSEGQAASAIVRTTAATTSPQPAGAAGLAYPAEPAGTGAETAFVFGLRSSPADRSNLAVFNPSGANVVVRVTVVDGSGSGRAATVVDDLDLPPLAWTQFSRVLDGTGITTGWARIEKVAGGGAFGAYGVVNDSLTNDGSFVARSVARGTGTRTTIPVLVETATFRSEIVLANKGASPASLTMQYVESESPATGGGGATTVTLPPGEQLIVPEAIDWLRRKGVGIGAAGAAGYVGTLRVSVAGVPLSELYVGARTASRSPAGGQFGLFAPGVCEGEEAADEAFLYGLRADANNRSNVVVLNAGIDSAGSATLEVRTYDGDEGGVERGVPWTVTLLPGQLRQLNNPLAEAGIRNGWVRVRRLAGTAPWIAYGVVNDGGRPGERTGDGAYVPMTVRLGSPLRPSESGP